MNERKQVVADTAENQQKVAFCLCLVVSYRMVYTFLILNLLNLAPLDNFDAILYSGKL